MTNHEKFVIFVNGEQFDVDQPELVGLQVRVLAQLGPEMSLVLEGIGPREDRIITDEDRIKLSAGPVHIYTKPPTNFGYAI